jgi:hypothetical protein
MARRNELSEQLETTEKMDLSKGAVTRAEGAERRQLQQATKSQNKTHSSSAMELRSQRTWSRRNERTDIMKQSFWILGFAERIGAPCALVE